MSMAKLAMATETYFSNLSKCLYFLYKEDKQLLLDKKEDKAENDQNLVVKFWLSDCLKKNQRYKQLANRLETWLSFRMGYI